MVNPRLKFGEAQPFAPRVYTRKKWTDDWEYREFLYPSGVVKHALPPDRSPATLVWEFYDLASRPGRGSEESVPPLDPDSVLDHYVKIDSRDPLLDDSSFTSSVSGGGLESIYHGFCVGLDTDYDKRSEIIAEPGGSTLPVGRQKFACVRVSELLKYKNIIWAHAYEDNQDQLLGYAPSFNTLERTTPVSHLNQEVSSSSTSLSRLGSISACERQRRTELVKGNKHPELPKFGNPGKLATGEGRWSLADIMDYMTQVDHLYIMPKAMGGDDDTLNNITWTPASQDVLDLLSSIFVVVSQDGRTAWELLNEMFNRRNGLYWDLLILPEDEYTPYDRATIFVDTTFGKPFSFGCFNYPANSRINSFNFAAVHPGQHIFSLPVVRLNRQDRVDEFVVQGQRIRVTATIDCPDILIPDWTDKELNEMVDPPGAAGSQEEDFHRSREKLKKVYRWFRITRDWNHRDYLGQNLSPFPFLDGRVDFSTHLGFWNRDKIILRDLALLAGVDYSQFPPLLFNLDENDGEYLPPLFLVATPTPVNNLVNTYVRVDQLQGLTDNAFLTDSHVRPFDDRMGFELITQNVLQFGLDGQHQIQSQAYRQLFNWKTIHATVTFETDQRQTLLENINPQHEINRRMVITVPDAHYWYVAPDTVVDIKAPKSTDVDNLELIHPDNLVLRDDLNKLQLFMATAKFWYSETRQSVIIEAKGAVSGTPATAVPPGTFIKEAVSPSHRDPINSIVTEVSYDFGATNFQQATRMKTDFFNLDASFLARAGAV